MESAVTELAQRTLNEVVASSRTVTRVAVTVRTATFYTRTKIRKLQAPSTDPDVITAAPGTFLTYSSWIGPSGCWECG